MTQFTPIFIPGLLCTADLFAAQIAHLGILHKASEVVDMTQDDSIADMACLL